jgi:hypothetical protein
LIRFFISIIIDIHQHCAELKKKKFTAKTNLWNCLSILSTKEKHRFLFCSPWVLVEESQQCMSLKGREFQLDDINRLSDFVSKKKSLTLDGTGFSVTKNYIFFLSIF